jgi:hypothetical protein
MPEDVNDHTTKKRKKNYHDDQLLTLTNMHTKEVIQKWRLEEGRMHKRCQCRSKILGFYPWESSCKVWIPKKMPSPRTLWGTTNNGWTRGFIPWKLKHGAAMIWWANYLRHTKIIQVQTQIDSRYHHFYLVGYIFNECGVQCKKWLPIDCLAG